MRILVDADSCPRRVRDHIARRGAKIGAEVIFAANRALPLPPGASLELVREGSVDDWIAARAGQGDLCVTRDIPLAARLLASGAAAINDRGDAFDPATIRERLSLRDAMLELSLSGLHATPKGSNYGDREYKSFCDCLERTLARIAARKP